MPWHDNLLHDLAAVFASYELNQSQAVEVTAHLTARAVAANAAQEAQAGQLEEAIKTIRDTHAVLTAA